MIPLALLEAHLVIGERHALAVGLEMLEFLGSVSFEDGVLQLVGNDGWYQRGGRRARTDEQPIDAAALVLAYRAAYRISGSSDHLDRMRACFAWFTGRNRAGLPLYDEASGGCRDGLGGRRLEENQGGERKARFLLAPCAM